MTIEDIKLTPEVHSNIVGGSTAARRIACPASLQMEALVPHVEEEESVYAAEGTALHEAMAHILEEDIYEMDTIVGREFYNHTMTTEQVEGALTPCVEFIDELCAPSPVKFEIEKSCKMPGIDGAFGTCDFIGKAENRSIILDFKFGAGVPVSAGNEEDGPNAQLAFYAVAAMETHPELFDMDASWPVDLIILQPRIPDEDGNIDRVFRSNVAELWDWHHKLLEKMKIAQSENPGAPCKGDHCRFAKCKNLCPAFTGPLLDLSPLMQDRNAVIRTEKMPIEEYAESLSHILELGEVAKELHSAAIKEATRLREAGHEVPGWDLFPKRHGNDKWKDDDRADAYMGRAGFPVAERRVKKPVTPAVARKMFKAAGKKLNEELHVDKGVSSGYTLGRADGRREPVQLDQVGALATRLKELSSS